MSRVMRKPIYTILYHFIPYANNKGADQPVHLRSLISAFIVRCRDSIIPILAISKLSRLCSFESCLVPTLADRFSRDVAQISVLLLVKYDNIKETGSSWGSENLIILLTQTFEPQHNKTNKMTCAPSKDTASDQYLRCLHEENLNP